LIACFVLLTFLGIVVLLVAAHEPTLRADRKGFLHEIQKLLSVRTGQLRLVLYAKRLFGLRGGGAAERAEREHDTGWEALERSFPPISAAAEPQAGAPAR